LDANVLFHKFYVFVSAEFNIILEIFTRSAESSILPVKSIDAVNPGNIKSSKNQFASILNTDGFATPDIRAGVYARFVNFILRLEPSSSVTVVLPFDKLFILRSSALSLFVTAV